MRWDVWHCSPAARLPPAGDGWWRPAGRRCPSELVGRGTSSAPPAQAAGPCGSLSSYTAAVNLKQSPLSLLNRL